MATQPKAFTAAAEYLRDERKTDVRSEYLGGQVYPVEAATAEHAAIVARLSAALVAPAAARGCTVYVSSLRVWAQVSDEYVYPDLVIVCGQPVFADVEADTLTNPTAVIEVLSKSTADYDRGGKFRLYKSIPTIKEYLTVSQTETLVECSTRQADQSWISRDFTSGSLTLAGIEIDIAGIYETVSGTAS